jgi:S-adenosyl methyltransferase
VADFDPTVPSIARVYDYLLDGKDNFAVDRAVAQKLLAVAPTAPNTQQSAQAVDAGARVVYVDIDAVVLAQLRAIAAQGSPGVTDAREWHADAGQLAPSSRRPGLALAGVARV